MISNLDGSSPTPFSKQSGDKNSLRIMAMAGGTMCIPKLRVEHPSLQFDGFGHALLLSFNTERFQGFVMAGPNRL
jgi:hypothetical protein